MLQKLKVVRVANADENWKKRFDKRGVSNKQAGVNVVLFHDKGCFQDKGISHDKGNEYEKGSLYDIGGSHDKGMVARHMSYLEKRDSDCY